MQTISPPRLAVRCAFLKMTMGATPGAGLVNICTHIIRDGSECIGPFLEETETNCRLWEYKAPG